MTITLGSLKWLKWSTINVMNYKESISFDPLYESMHKAMRSVLHKRSVAHFYLNDIEEICNLEYELNTSTYVPRKIRLKKVTSPKPRTVAGNAFRDRVYHGSFHDNVLYPKITKSFIYDNGACQKGKGTDFARKRLIEMLRSYYRKHGADGFVIQLDIEGYYPNMPHVKAEEKYMRILSKDEVNPCVEILRQQGIEEGKGYYPGSPIVQLTGVSYQNRTDHWLKECRHAKYYERYNDDSIIIHKSREWCEETLKLLEKRATQDGMRLNRKKTRIYSLKEGIPFLGFVIRLSETGKVYMTIKQATVRRYKRHIKHYVEFSLEHGIPLEDADTCFMTWLSHVEKGNSYYLTLRLIEYYHRVKQEEKKRYAKNYSSQSLYS